MRFSRLDRHRDRRRRGGALRGRADQEGLPRGIRASRLGPRAECDSSSAILATRRMVDRPGGIRPPNVGWGLRPAQKVFGGGESMRVLARNDSTRDDYSARLQTQSRHEVPHF